MKVIDGFNLGRCIATAKHLDLFDCSYILILVFVKNSAAIEEGDPRKGNKKINPMGQDDPHEDLSQDFNASSEGNKRTNVKERKLTSQAETPPPSININDDDALYLAINYDVELTKEEVSAPSTNADGAK